jgi:hypothetical protein
MLIREGLRRLATTLAVVREARTAADEEALARRYEAVLWIMQVWPELPGLMTG